MLPLLAKLGAMLAGPLTQAITGINLSAVFGALVASVRQYWKLYLIAALALTQGTTAYMWRRDHAELLAERAAHTRDVQSYKDAQAAAAKRAADIKAQMQHDNERQADEADKDYSALYERYRANLLRYEAAQSSPHRSSGGQQASPAEDPYRSGQGPFVPDGSITITNEDANICAVNTARLVAAHDWAENLNESH